MLWERIVFVKILCSLLLFFILEKALFLTMSCDQNIFFPDLNFLR